MITQIYAFIHAKTYKDTQTHKKDTHTHPNPLAHTRTLIFMHRLTFT